MLYNNLKSKGTLRADMSTDNVFIIDKDLNQRGRIDGRDKKEIDSDYDDNGEYEFYSSHYEQLHHIIFHLYSMGLRTDSTEINGNDDLEENKNENNNNIDLEFAAKRDLIKSKRKNMNLSDLSRYTDDNNKYNLNINTFGMLLFGIFCCILCEDKYIKT